MRKKNKLLLMIIFFLSICLLLCLVAFAYDRQSRKDAGNNSSTQADTSKRNEPKNSDAESAAEQADNPSTSTAADPADRIQSESGQSAQSASGNDTVDSNNEPTDGSIEAADGSIADLESSPALSPAPSAESGPIVLAFAGDVNLDENSYPVKKYDAENKDITKCLSEDLLKEMIDADIMMLNNEFAYSTRGTKTPDKSYTFRADPDRVNILKEMGVDLVSLANNHALDYGQDALIDTFTTLEEAAIDYVGAGMNMDRAKAPVYYTVKGKKIAYVSASRVIFATNWYATDSRPGMVGTYDPALIVEVIKEAKANSDYVIVYVHWGVERVNYPEKYQRTLATKYIDAGADAVIGCHPHVMQGFEFYKGKPIAYSLSNFWFSRATVDSALFKLHIDEDGQLKSQLLPVMAKNTYSYIVTDEKEKERYYDFIKEISFDIEIDRDGFLSAK